MLKFKELKKALNLTEKKMRLEGKEGKVALKEALAEMLPAKS